MMMSSISGHQLSQLNQDGCSPLHLASAAGHLEIITYLLEFGKQKSVVEELCMKKDRDGRTALHSAVINGKIDVIDVLFVHCPQAAKEVTVQQETVLHLAVKHHQQESLEFLIDQKFGSSVESLLNLCDRRGNTVLHLATANKQFQTVEYLVKQPNLNVNAKNSYGLRALDIKFVPPQNISDTSSGSGRQSEDWFKEQRSKIIVMASIFATITFKVALTPPGGVWQDWGLNATTSNTSVIPAHQPGVPILYDLDPPYVVSFNVTFMAVEFLAIGSFTIKESMNLGFWLTSGPCLLMFVVALDSFFVNTADHIITLVALDSFFVNTADHIITLRGHADHHQIRKVHEIVH
ncbi:UNVERIFIED_CONTAM: hypothetical protein Slati_4309200 [Sesamum latifolium]|uniref:PGG domain-containing protein n=1 Tax=Sesamum latifolium TaxID=2727402 RepID=A0AAW2SLT9_9LAMI